MKLRLAGKVNGRPCDILKLDANSFLVSDDHSGIIYLMRAKGSQAAAAAKPASETRSRAKSRRNTSKTVYAGNLFGTVRR